MTTFLNDREKAIEDKFGHDETVKFHINTKAANLFGGWAAEKLQLAGDDASKYAEAVVDTNFSGPGSLSKIFAKVQQDLSDKGIVMTNHHIENEYNVHLDRARKFIMTGA